MNLKHLHLSKSLYTFNKIKFTSCVNQYLKLSGLCFYLKKLTFKVFNKFKTLKSFKINLYLLQNKIHQLCKLLSKIEMIKYLVFFVKTHVFRVKNFDMLKNEILKKQAKTQNFGVQKIKNCKKH